MNQEQIYKKYFALNTTGYLIVLKFYRNYKNVLVKSQFPSFEDALHEVYLSITKIKFEHIVLPDNYIHRAIKIQCWALLDRVQKEKAQTDTNYDHHKNESQMYELTSDDKSPLDILQYSELLTIIMRFKSLLSNDELKTFELLDETADSFLTDIAKKNDTNINTIRTKIFRLRRKFDEHLKTWGYESRWEKNRK